MLDRGNQKRLIFFQDLTLPIIYNSSFCFIGSNFLSKTATLIKLIPWHSNCRNGEQHTGYKCKAVKQIW